MTRKMTVLLASIVLIVAMLIACDNTGDLAGNENAVEGADKSEDAGDDSDNVASDSENKAATEKETVEEEKEIWEASELAKYGYVDVTLYGADPAGKKDSTEAIQAAVDAAYANFMVTYFPSGTYIVSDTIKMWRKRDSDQFRTRKGHVLVGSTEGERPLIKLTDNNPLFQDASVEDTSKGNPTTTRAVFHFWTNPNNNDPNPESEAAQFDYNQVIRGIDIDLGEGNPGAVGIRHRGAEGSSTQDVKIYVRDGFAGIYSLLGSGGSTTNIEIIGGKYGIYARKTQPMPVVTGVKLTGQRDYAIYYGGLTPLTVVGFEVEKAEGPIFKVDKYDSAVDSWGNIALIDGKVEVASGGKDAVLVENTDRMVYIQNVYLKNAGTIAANVYDGSAALVKDPAVWNRIDEYAYGKNFDTGSQTKLIDMVSTNVTQRKVTEGSEAPPADLITRHIWDENYWTAEHADVVSVMEFGAAGDGITDDTAAIQAAIDAAAASGKNRVLLPKGRYRVSDSIQLREHTKLFGVARHLSVLEPYGWSEETNTPIIKSANAKDATNVLANLKIELYGTRYNIYAIDWQAGRHSIVKDVWVCWDYDSTRSSNVQQWVRIPGNGGGKWYNHQTEIGANTNAKGYRGVLVDGTTEPLVFYQFHNQHVKSDAISEVRNAANVTFYGVKTETQTEGGGEHHKNPNGPWPRSLIVANSENIEIHGYSGMGQTKPGQGLIEIVESSNVIVTNMGRWSSNVHPLDQWHYILVTQDGKTAGITADTTVNLVKVSSRQAKDVTAPVWDQAKLVAPQVTGSAVTLSWPDASDDTAVVAYDIYVDGELLKTVNSNAKTITADALKAATSYTFKVEARDAAGNMSAAGPELTVTTKPSRLSLEEISSE